MLLSQLAILSDSAIIPHHRENAIASLFSAAESADMVYSLNKLILITYTSSYYKHLLKVYHNFNQFQTSDVGFDIYDCSDSASFKSSFCLWKQDKKVNWDTHCQVSNLRGNCLCCWLSDANSCCYYFPYDTRPVILEKCPSSYTKQWLSQLIEQLFPCSF